MPITKEMLTETLLKSSLPKHTPVSGPHGVPYEGESVTAALEYLATCTDKDFAAEDAQQEAIKLLEDLIYGIRFMRRHDKDLGRFADFHAACAKTLESKGS